MKVRFWMLVLFIVMMTAAAVSAQDDAVDSPLLAMLRYVPNDMAYRQYVTYGDAAAWHASWDVPRIDNLDELDALPEYPRAYWMNIFPRQTVPANVLGMQYLQVDDLRGFYGFDLFNVDRYLEAGSPPDSVSVIDFAFDPTQIADTLTASGYEAQDVDGGTLYSILEDYEIDMTREKITTRAGQLGALNRIALLDQRLIVTRATPVVERALEVASSGTSLADDPVFIAGAAALQNEALDSAGDLVGATLVDGLMLAPPDPIMAILGEQATAEKIAELQAQFEAQPPLSQYLLAVFAVYHTPGQTSMVLALVFPPGVDAAAAAESVSKRIEGYTSLRTRELLLESYRLTLGEPVGIEAGGYPVALVTLRGDDPPLELPEGEGIPGSVPTNAPRWIDTIAARDIGFLAVNAE